MNEIKITKDFNANLNAFEILKGFFVVFVVFFYNCSNEQSSHKESIFKSELKLISNVLTWISLHPMKISVLTTVNR